MNQAKVLIAVRDEAASNFFQAALGGEGYRLETARTGRDALERTLAFMPDVVLADAVLPELSGTALAGKIKGDPTTAPMSVLLVLEPGAADGFAEGRAAGADDFLVKPFTMEVLLARVRSLARLGQLQVRLRTAVTSHPAVQADRRERPAARPGLVLIVEDDPHVAQVFGAVLGTGGYHVMSAPQAEAADRQIAADPPNLILLDLMLPGANGLEWMQGLKQNPLSRHIPVIIVTAIDDVKAKVAALNMGADDYLVKPVDDQQTGLYGRRYLESLMVRDAALSRQKGLPLTLLVLDVDRFTELAAAAGPGGGDLVLKAVADVLKTELRGSDLAVRYGDDVFTVTLYGIYANQAIIIADRLRNRTQRLAVAGLAPGSVTVSIGVGEFTAADNDLRTVLQRAELAMRIAKSSGRNRVVAGSDDRT
ncbi:MAG: response regulator [Candidatus Edwardsbacteria bacterium]|nr:response regulator [Candidatus Edwardsbacteria bacterium]